MRSIASAALLAALAAPAMAAGTEFSSDVPKLASDAGTTYFDSDWQCTDNHRQRFEIKHNLGSAPRFFSLYFAPTREALQVFSVTWPWQADYSGNPVTVEVTNEAIVLNIFEGTPLHGVWNGANGEWQKFNQGCFRAFMIR